MDSTRAPAGVALVTGASSGIGHAIALTLAQAGYRTFGTSRHSESAMAEGVEPLQLDVTDDRSVDAGVAAVRRLAGRIDVLVNNAGFALVGAIEDSSLEQTREIFETNLFGVMRVTRAVLPGMRERRAGRIINISSVIGFLPGPFSSLYCATKHALEGYSESLDHEVRTLGVRSILIEPGFVSTRIADNMPVPDRPLADYAPGREAVRMSFEKAFETASAPEAVGDVVLKAVTALRPKVRYTAGRDAAVLSKLRRLLPTAFFEKSFRKQFGLEPA